MRATTLLRRLLGVIELRVREVWFLTNGSLAAGVAPRWRRPRCGGCGRVGPIHDYRPRRWWKHAVQGATSILVSYAPRRVRCRRCGVRCERLPWADGTSRFTLAFEEWVAYLAQVTDKTQVRRQTGVAWKTVGSIVARVVGRSLSEQRLVGLKRIGIDDFSYRKRHRYLTVVVNHDRRRVVWAGEGRNSQALAAFFDLLGEKGCAALELVTMDMASGYKKAVEERLPKAQIVFDRFHVQQLASNALDEVRRALVREAEGGLQAASVKKARWVLLKRPENLTRGQRQRLQQIKHVNRPLYRAYLLKETLADALSYLQPKRAREALDAWIGWAVRSRLKPFQRIARTIRQHRHGILAYIRHRLTNGLVEGLNNKMRAITRRAFGFHSAEALIAMIYLNCGGIRLSPPLPAPTGR